MMERRAFVTGSLGLVAAAPAAEARSAEKVYLIGILTGGSLRFPLIIHRGAKHPRRPTRPGGS